MIPPARPVAIGLRLYRALANAFPYEFQNAYGDELMQMTEEAIKPVWRRRGILGLLRLLLAASLSTIARSSRSGMSDPLLLVGAPLLLAALALMACYLPARKSLRIDPAVSLREE